MNEFLSRFVHSIRPILAQSFPELTKKTLDSMLLLICQRVVTEMDGSTQEATVDLSEDLWRTIHDVSKSVHEAMRRDRMREELKKYLHHDDVKKMCHFAGDIGIRGGMLREFRFKWAREKLEEVEFYRSLERIRENATKEEEEGERKSKPVESLPERKGRIKYKIYGLDLSDPKWTEIAERVEEEEGKFVKDEPKPVVGRSKRVEEKFFGLDWKKDELMPVLKEWAEALEAKRVDWLALLERIKERNSDLYFKVAELLLEEESFETNIRDYSKLIDAHSKADRLEDAERILNKMTEKGIKPDVLTSNILVHMYSKAGKLDEAKASFTSLKKEGFQPDLKAYTSMITAYVNAGLPKQAEALTREMEAKGIKPTKEIYLELLRAFANGGEVDAAQRIVNTMQFAGIQQNLESYTLLIDAYGKAGDPDQARVHFDHMREVGRIMPDDRCTASMLAAYVKKNLLDKGLDLLLTLKKQGFVPGVHTNTVLVGWLGRLQLVEEAEQVLEEIKAMGDVPFEIHVSLCDMYSRAGDVEKAKKAQRILVGRKELLTADQFERIIQGMMDGGMKGEANRMSDLMKSLGFSQSNALSVSLMAAKSFPLKTTSFSPNRSGTRR